MKPPGGGEERDDRRGQAILPYCYAFLKDKEGVYELTGGTLKREVRREGNWILKKEGASNLPN